MLQNRSRRNIFKIAGASLASAGIVLSPLFQSDKARATYTVDFRPAEIWNADLSQKTDVSTLKAAYVPLPKPVPSGEQTLIIANLPANLVIAHAWMSEGTPNGDRPFYGGSTWKTYSVQANPDLSSVRIVFSHDNAAPIWGGAQIIYGYR